MRTITREEAINTLARFKRYISGGGVVDLKANKALDMVIEALKNERPKGHWVKKWSGNGWNEDWDYTCSVCEKEYKKAGSVLYHSSYCPNCGARMKGADDE